MTCGRPGVETPEAPGTVREALRWAVRRLEGTVDAPAVDAELLLRHVLACSRALLLSDPERALDEQGDRFRVLVERRAGGEPLQYLTAVQAFRQLELAVGPGVLVPRPETELVVERALTRLRDVERSPAEGVVVPAPVRARGGGWEGAARSAGGGPTAPPVVVDIGTGSGAIALSVGVERPDAAVWATEVSGEALRWARRNLEAVAARNVTVVEGDLFGPLPGELRGKVDLVVANPPYLSEAELAEAPADVREHEPALATTAGVTGLEVVSRIAEEAVVWLRPGGWLVLETHPGQAGRLQSLMLARYADVAVHPDLAGVPRIAEGRRPPGS